MKINNIIQILFVSIIAIIYLYSSFAPQIKKGIQRKKDRAIKEKRKQIFNDLTLSSIEFVDFTNINNLKRKPNSENHHTKIAIRGTFKNESDKFVGNIMCIIKIGEDDESIIILWPELDISRDKDFKPIEPFSKQEFFHYLFKDDLEGVTFPINFKDIEIDYIDYKKFNTLSEYNDYKNNK